MRYGFLGWLMYPKNLHWAIHADCPGQKCSNLAPHYFARTVRPGTTIWSDEWRANSRVGHLPGVTSHGVVNHSLYFVEPVTGVHTQAIESYWNRVKTNFKRMKGVSGEQLPLHLDEFMWRERYGTSAGLTLSNIIEHISEIYPV